MTYVQLPLQGGTTATIDGDYLIAANATERGVISHEDGKRVWQSDTKSFYISDGTNWNLVNGQAVSPADTYFVSTAGNDTTGNGSQSQPWASLKKAVTEANANSTAINPISIILEPGVYTEDNSAGAITVTAQGVCIQSDAALSCIVQPNTVGNDLLSVTNTNFTLKAITLTGATGASNLVLSGTAAIQRLIEVTSSNSLTGVEITNTGTVIFDACIFATYGKGIDLTAGEFIMAACAFLGSGNPASPSGTAVQVATGARSLADSVRMSSNADGYLNTGGSIIAYSTDFVSNDYAVRGTGGACVLLGGTLRNCNTAAVKMTTGGVRIKSCSMNQTGALNGTGNAIDLDGNSLGVIHGCAFTGFAKAITVTNSGTVTNISNVFSGNTLDLEQADASSTATTISVIYDSTKLSYADKSNIVEFAYHSDRARIHTTGDIETDGVSIYEEQATDPSAEAEKVKLYAKLSTSTASTQLMLHFNNGNGSTSFTDSSSSARTVTANGDAQQSTGIIKFGTSSGLFDGTGDYLSVANKTGIAWNSSFTIETWVYTTNFSNNRTIFSNSTDASNYVRLDSSSGNIRASLVSGGTSIAVITGSALTTSRWVHIAFVKNGNDYTLYVDGVQQATTTNATVPASIFSNDLIIGARVGGTNAFDGYMDEFRISSSARYTSSFNKPAAPFDTGIMFTRLSDGSILPLGSL